MSPDELEARSTPHAADCFRARQLASGTWAIYGPDCSLWGIIPRLDEVKSLPLFTLARTKALRDRASLEAALAANRARAQAQADLNNLELDL